MSSEHGPIARPTSLDALRSLTEADGAIITNVDLSASAVCFDLKDKELQDALTKCPNLTTLILKNCELLKASGLNAIATKCTTLKVLDLSGCTNLTSPILNQIALANPGITQLNISDCDKLTDAGKAELRGILPTAEIIGERIPETAATVPTTTVGRYKAGVAAPAALSPKEVKAVTEAFAAASEAEEVIATGDGMAGLAALGGSAAAVIAAKKALLPPPPAPRPAPRPPVGAPPAARAALAAMKAAGVGDAAALAALRAMSGGGGVVTAAATAIRPTPPPRFTPPPPPRPAVSAAASPASVILASSIATAGAIDRPATYEPSLPPVPDQEDTNATVAAILAARTAGGDADAVTKAALLAIARQKAAASEAAKR